MNQQLALCALVLFLALPPLLFFVRYRVGASMPWLLLTLIVAVGSWVLVNFGTYFYSEFLCEGLPEWNPPMEALARCTGDGGRTVFALMFGWLYGIWYSLPYALLFALSASIRRWKTRAETTAV